MFDPFRPLTEIARSIRHREITAVEVATAYLERIERFNPRINCYVWWDGDAVLASATRADEQLAAGKPVGPFHGVPVPIKDLTRAANQPCFYGSMGIVGSPPPSSDPVVAQLESAGFLLMGRTAAPEAGTMCVTENQRFGICRNPWDLTRSPGGSSGGAAAAVAAGLAPAAQASDGGGSIRGPASCCGLVGLKPSRGRVPRAVVGWEHAVTDGAETRTVADSAALLDAISHPDRLAMYNAPPPGRPFATETAAPPQSLRIGLLLDAPTGVAVDHECRDAVTRTATILEEQGHAVYPTSPSFYSDEAVHGYLTHIMDAAVAALPYEKPELAEPYLRRRMERAWRTSSAEYVATALRLQRESRAVIEQFGHEFDLLLTPTMATCPVPAGVLIDEANTAPDDLRTTELRMVSFASWVNLAGLPAISLPLHESNDGMPVGVQLVAGPWEEDVLLRVASRLEQALPWAHRHPSEFDTVR